MSTSSTTPATENNKSEESESKRAKGFVGLADAINKHKENEKVETQEAMADGRVSDRGLDRFNIRQAISLAYLPYLNEEEKNWLKFYFIRKIRRETFLKIMQQDHAFQDRLEYANILYGVNYFRTCLRTIKKAAAVAAENYTSAPEDPYLFLSFRANDSARFFQCVLLEDIPGMEQELKDKLKEVFDRQNYQKNRDLDPFSVAN